MPRLLCRALGDRRGAVAVIVAIAAPVLIGFTALGTDVAYWYGSREAMQAGVDAAAFAAAHFAGSGIPLAATELVAINAANGATGNQFGFNSQNLTTTVEQCYKDGIGVGQGEVECPGDPAYHADKAASAAGTSLGAVWVIVDANMPQPTFFIGALIPGLQPKLAFRAASLNETSLTPPPNDTCVTSVGNTGVGPGGSFHEGGPSFGSCGDTGSLLTQMAPIPGREGYLNQTAYHLNDNGGSLPAAAKTLPSSAPNCDSLYNPADPTVNAGDPGSTTSNGIPVYFGPATATSKGYGFSPVLVGPGSRFCDASNVCTVPAGAYCGGLQVEPGVTMNFTDTGTSSNFMILDGNLVVPSTGITYGHANDPNASFQFGGSSVGWLMQNTQTAVYPGEIQNGTMVYTTTTTSVLQNTGSSVSEDQICPGGVVAAGIGSGGVPICPAITQATNAEGQTNTGLSGSQTVPGQTTKAYGYDIGSTPLQQVDTYVIKVTFQNGIPVYSQAAETTTTSLYDSGTGRYEQIASGGSIGLSVSGAIGGNTAAVPDAASNDCQSSSRNNLFSSETPAGQGYSFAGSAGRGYTQQVDTIEVCGTGPQLTPNPSGAEIIASGTMTSHIFLTQ